MQGSKMSGKSNCRKTLEIQKNLQKYRKTLTKIEKPNNITENTFCLNGF
jgi:hypothetical protein